MSRPIVRTHVTYEELCQMLPEGTLCELIDGEVFMLDSAATAFRLHATCRPGETATTALLPELRLSIASLLYA